MKVKICGITNADDARWAVNYGADYIGINFVKESPRHISIANATKWIDKIPSWTSLVGVFVNAEQKDLVHIVNKLKLKGIQLHGDESVEYINAVKSELESKGIKVFVIKAVRVQDEEDLRNLESYKGAVDYFLLDSKVTDVQGGSGETFNWDLAEKAKDIGIPLILAGGLTPDNIQEAVKKVQPFGVDVASGVEKSPRKKDLDKMSTFISKAKG